MLKVPCLKDPQEENGSVHSLAFCVIYASIISKVVADRLRRREYPGSNIFCFMG